MTAIHARHDQCDYPNTENTPPGHEDEMNKTLADRVAHAAERGSHWLDLAKEAAEQGRKEKAGRLYAKGQLWLDHSKALREGGK